MNLSVQHLQWRASTPLRAVILRPVFAFIMVLSALLASPSLRAAPEFYLVTYGPGTEVWERFGHNALWLRDPVTGEEAMFNFGFFDFAQRGFFKNFLLGRMLYFAAATDPAREFPFYQRYGRSVEYQRLNLSSQQAERLAQHLRYSVQPETREYLYDYFLDNCSTRVRDALDLALNGELSTETQTFAFESSFRRSALTMVQDDFWLYLGMQLGLGRSTDRPLDLWQAFYLPHVLKLAMVDEALAVSRYSQPVQKISAGYDVPQRLHAPYGRFLLMGLVTCVLLWSPVLLRIRTPFWRALPCRLWWLVSGMAGVLLGFLWLATDHQAAWYNENILLLPPWALIPAIFWASRWSRIAAYAIGTGVFVSLIMKLLSFNQFNYDLLLWLVPAQCMALILFFRSKLSKSPA